MGGWLQYLTTDLTKTPFQITFNNPGLFKHRANAAPVTHFALSPPLHKPGLGGYVLMVPIQIEPASSGPAREEYDSMRHATQRSITVQVNYTCKGGAVTGSVTLNVNR